MEAELHSSNFLLAKFHSYSIDRSWTCVDC